MRPRAKRRHDHDEFVQAVVEVLPEAPGQDLIHQRDVIGGENAHIHGHRVASAEGPDLAFLQHAKELGLNRQRKVRDLVEEEAASLRELEVPVLPLTRAGERPLFVAEQLGLDQRLRNPATVERDEGSCASKAQLVNRPRDELLSRAGLPLNEDREVRVGDLADLPQDILDLSTRAHQRAE